MYSLMPYETSQIKIRLMGTKKNAQGKGTMLLSLPPGERSGETFRAKVKGAVNPTQGLRGGKN